MAAYVCCPEVMYLLRPTGIVFVVQPAALLPNSGACTVALAQWRLRQDHARLVNGRYMHGNGSSRCQGLQVHIMAFVTPPPEFEQVRDKGSTSAPPHHTQVQHVLGFGADA